MSQVTSPIGGQPAEIATHLTLLTWPTTLVATVLDIATATHVPTRYRLWIARYGCTSTSFGSNVRSSMMSGDDMLGYFSAFGISVPAMTG